MKKTLLVSLDFESRDCENNSFLDDCLNEIALDIKRRCGFLIRTGYNPVEISLNKITINE